MKNDKAVSSGSATDVAAARLKRDIEQTRADMAEKINELETRLSPSEVREKVGVELQRLEERVRVVVREQLAEAKTLVQDELLEAKSLLRDEMNEAEQRLKTGLGEAKESLKKDLRDAYSGATKSLRDATLGKVESLATDLGDKMNETRDTLVETMRSNPLPTAIMGVGLGWLLMNRSKSASSRTWPQGPRYRSPDAYRDRPDGIVDQLGTAVGQAGAAVGQAAQQATDAVGQGWRQASGAAGQALHGASETAATLAQRAGDTAAFDPSSWRRSHFGRRRCPGRCETRRAGLPQYASGDAVGGCRGGDRRGSGGGLCDASDCGRRCAHG